VRSRRWSYRTILLVGLGLIAIALVLTWFISTAITRKKFYEAVRAIQERGEPILPADFDQPALPDSENALALFALAAKLAPDPGLQIPIEDVFNHDEVCELYPDVLAAYHEELELARSIVRDAIEIPTAARLNLLRSPLVDRRHPELSGYRRIARSMCAAAELDMRRGNQQSFVRTMHDQLVFANRLHQSHTCTLVDHLLAIGVRRLVVQQISCHALQLNFAECVSTESVTMLPRESETQSLITALLDDAPVWHSGWMAYCGERTYQVDLVLWVMTNAGQAGSASSLLEYCTLKLARPMLYHEARLIVEDMSHLIDTFRMRPEPDELIAALPVIDSRKSPRFTIVFHFRSMIIPSLKQGILLHYRIIGDCRMAATAIAMRLFELDHGRLPTDVRELAPQYLPTVPVDPFSPVGDPIRLVVDDQRVMLYSVGNDGVDDGGSYSLNKTGGISRESRDHVFFLSGGPARTAWEPPSDLRAIDGAQDANDPLDESPIEEVAPDEN
jgi:hypothetical protein